MKLYVGNIPRLANEEALTAWFARAGVRVESIDLLEEQDSQRCAWVKITGEGLPSKALQHLNYSTFWGRHLVVRKGESRSRQRLWPRSGFLASLETS